MTEPDPRFEHRVVAALRAEADRWFVLAATAGLHAVPLRLHVDVTTWLPLRTRTRKQIFQLLVRELNRNLPAARLGNVLFGESRALPAPGHRFLFQPPLGAAPPQRAPTRPYPSGDPGPYPCADRTRLDRPPDRAVPPAAGTEPGPGRDSALAALTLRYGTVLDWRCHLGAVPGWVPLGRWPVRADPHAGFRLPAYATFVPRGQLVVLRRRGRRLEFARTAARPGYVVRLDGVPLRGDGSPATARTTGHLEYGDGSATSTVIDYHIAWGHTVG
jgi:hypothetical protein